MPQETCRQFLEIANFLPWLIKRLRAQGMDYNKASAKSFGVLLSCPVNISKKYTGRVSAPVSCNQMPA